MGMWIIRRRRGGREEEGEIPHVPLVAHSIYTFHLFSLPNEYVSQDSSNSRWDVIEIDRRRKKDTREMERKKKPVHIEEDGEDR